MKATLMSNMRKELALRTITLRGIGPYYEGARLDIKPLTILCGENGSGKSTWFKALDLLKRSQERGLLPFAFAEASDYYHDFTNSYLKTFPQATGPVDRAADNQFGPRGTIGLHFEAVEDLSLANEEATDAPTFGELGSLPQAFLWQGLCQKGTQFRLRLAHPSTNPSTEELEKPSLLPYDLVELRINEIYCIKFRKRSGEERDAFECSRALLPGHDEDEDGTVCFAQVEVKGVEAKVYPVDGSSDFDLLEPLCRHAIVRIRQLIREVLAGFFYISAIREIEIRKNISEQEEATDGRDAAIRHRYVGPTGKQTWDLESAFAFNLMRLPRDHQGMEPASQDFTEKQICGWGDIWDARGGSAFQRILEIASAETWGEVAKAVERWEDLNAARYGMVGEDFDAAKFRLGQESGKIHAAMAAFFNTVLGHRNLYRKEVWTDLEGEAQALVQQGPENLTVPEIRRLNRRLIQAAFNRPRHQCISRVPRMRLEMYVTFWLKQLVETRIVLPEAAGEYPSLGKYWASESAPPVGFLASQNPDRGPRPSFDIDGEDIPERNPTSLERFLHDCFDGYSPTPVSPGYLSAGFHQIAPIVVQGALLRQNEIMAVENPEVHLHPSLQLDITEYLVREAKAGKVIVVETHSDLVVRRVLRAILREDIRQAHVAVYFASLKLDESSKYHFASLESIQINDRGQVANWPKGFMDDDVRESRRLMEAVYGTIPEEGEPEDEEADE